MRLEKGKLVIFGLQGNMLDSSLRKQSVGEFKVLDGKIIKINQAPIAKVISKNGIYYIFNQEDLSKLFTARLAENYEINFGNRQKIVYNKDSTVTFQKPFAAEVTIDGKQVLIPAIIEFGDKKDVVYKNAFTVSVGSQVVSKDSNPILVVND